ncbi:MAG: GSCFA domain-containing protein, partial [Bacteroidaceae bacterium]|nr:GSCFA domain-containing protein [Bacteroidaceae bacterium]
ELMTRIDIPASEWKIPAGAKVLLVGSCFADEIGEKMVRGGFEATVNPFGTLYNPASIAGSLLRSISEREYTPDSPELIQDEMEGIWHSWMHHSVFSSRNRSSLIEKVNVTMREVAHFLREADVLIVTFGTAIIYRLKETGMLVANCHKQPDSLFVRERMSSYDIVDQWQMLLQLLESVNPKLKIIFTVSPIRHKRDGYHVNQVSKGILLQATDEIVNSKSSDHQWDYFPSYEIMMDELRDYRFYADDMIHPSAKAVEYIWQRFQDTYFDNRTKDVVAKAEKVWRQHQHRQIVNSNLSNSK